MNSKIRYDWNRIIFDASITSLKEAIAVGDSRRAKKYYDYVLNSGNKALSLADEDTIDLIRIDDALEVTKELYQSFLSESQTVSSPSVRAVVKSAQRIEISHEPSLDAKLFPDELERYFRLKIYAGGKLVNGYSNLRIIKEENGLEDNFEESWEKVFSR